MPDTEAGRALLARGEMVHPDPAHPAIGVRMIATATVREAVRAIEREARSRALAEVRARVEGLPTFPRDGAAGPISMVARAAVLVAIDAAAKDGTWMTTGSAAIEEVSRRG